MKAQREELVRRNLRDAGLGGEAEEAFLRYGREGMLKEQERILQSQRKLLLERLHRDQRMIDSLDYLIYTLKSNGGKEE